MVTTIPGRKKTQLKYNGLLDERQKVLYNNTATLAEVSAVYGGVLNQLTVCKPLGAGTPFSCSRYIISLDVFFIVYLFFCQVVF